MLLGGLLRQQRQLAEDHRRAGGEMCQQRRRTAEDRDRLEPLSASSFSFGHRSDRRWRPVPEKRRKQRAALEALALLDARDRHSHSSSASRRSSVISSARRRSTARRAARAECRGRANHHRAHLGLAALGDRVEAPQAVDLVAEELDPQRQLVAGRKISTIPPRRFSSPGSSTVGAIAVAHRDPARTSSSRLCSSPRFSRTVASSARRRQGGLEQGFDRSDHDECRGPRTED